MYGYVPIEPVALPGQHVLLINSQRFELYQVAYVEPIPASHPFVANFGAIGAGLQAPIFNTTNILDMQRNHLGRFRAYVLDDIHAVVSQPQQLSRWGTLNQNARLNAYARLQDPCDHLTQFHVFGQDRIFVLATNPTGVALVQARVAFYGYRHVLEGTAFAGPPESAMPVPIRTFGSIQEAVAWSQSPGGVKFTAVDMGGWSR